MFECENSKCLHNRNEKRKEWEFGRCKIDIRQNFTIEIYGSNNNRTVYWIGKNLLFDVSFFFFSSSIALFDFFFWSFFTFFIFFYRFPPFSSHSFTLAQFHIFTQFSHVAADRLESHFRFTRGWEKMIFVIAIWLWFSYKIIYITKNVQNNVCHIRMQLLLDIYFFTVLKILLCHTHSYTIFSLWFNVSNFVYRIVRPIKFALCVSDSDFNSNFNSFAVSSFLTIGVFCLGCRCRCCDRCCCCCYEQCVCVNCVENPLNKREVIIISSQNLMFCILKERKIVCEQ